VAIGPAAHGVNVIEQLPPAVIGGEITVIDCCCGGTVAAQVEGVDFQPGVRQAARKAVVAAGMLSQTVNDEDTADCRARRRPAVGGEWPIIRAGYVKGLQSRLAMPMVRNAGGGRAARHRIAAELV